MSAAPRYAAFAGPASADDVSGAAGAAPVRLFALLGMGWISLIAWVVYHWISAPSLADHRRELHVERLGETYRAPPEFMLVISYNPGYQSALKELKQSTRQRFAAIELTYAPAEIELSILRSETGVDAALGAALVKLAQAVRQLDVEGLPEVASTRTLISTASLVQSGLSPRTGCPRPWSSISR